MHWRLDGKKPRGKPRSGPGSSGVFVHAGRWRVDVAEEQELFDGRVLSGMMEFYLIALRRICAGLDLPVALGSHKLGMMIAAASDASSLRLQVQGMEHWPEIASSFKNAREALFPVIFDDARVKRKCLLLRVCATEASETLVTASRLRVHVCDHVARKGLGRELAQKVVGLIRSVGSAAENLVMDVVIEQRFPVVDMDYDYRGGCLGDAGGACR